MNTGGETEGAEQEEEQDEDEEQGLGHAKRYADPLNPWQPPRGGQPSQASPSNKELQGYPPTPFPAPSHATNFRAPQQPRRVRDSVYN